VPAGEGTELVQLTRIRTGESTTWASVVDGVAVELPDGPFEGRRGAEIGSVEGLQLLAPVEPGKIVCVGLNYAAHVTERDPNRKLPEEPVLFMKPQSALVGPGADILIAHPEHENHHEAELAVVIGRTTRQVGPERALDYVLGYTCANDVSDRDLQKQDGQFVRAKGFDTYCPVGPWVETELDPSDVLVESWVNGQVRQSQSTRQMLWDVPRLISFISWVMTLEPGDLILTGTPDGVGPLRHGDVCEISVAGIGALTNPVRNAETVPPSFRSLRNDG
jgi:2-keto-4-pentenoate hydratase/2-oxohepta-3-ene-1,7-dioic acid hydratase in catechol pathway